MRLSTQRKKDLKENDLNAKSAVKISKDEKRKLRNKKKGIIISFATNNQKPPNRKKNPALRTPPELDKKATTSMAKPVHQKYPEYIGLRKWKQ